MSIGKTVKLMRITSGLKQKDLAEQLGVTTNYLSLIENNKREPSFTFLKSLAKEIKVPLGVLLFDIDENESFSSQEERQIYLKIKDLMWEIENIRSGNG